MKKDVTIDQKKMFLKLTGWTYSGTWWMKTCPVTGCTIYEYFLRAYQTELKERNCQK